MSRDTEPSNTSARGDDAALGTEVLWQRAYDAGHAAARAGEADDAELHWREAVALAEQFAAPDLRLARSCEDLGDLRAQFRRFDESAALFRRALEFRERLYGPIDSSVGETLYHLAWSLWQSGRGREAEPLLRRALPLAEAAHGPRSLRVAHLLNNLALLLAEGGEDDDQEQEELLDRALSIKTEVLGTTHPELAGTLNNLALLHSRRAHWDQAITSHRQALEIRQSSLPAEHPDLAETCGNLGRLLLERGRPTEAEPLLRQAVGIERDPVRQAALLESLAAARHAARDYAGALSLLDQALSIKEQYLGKTHRDLPGMLSNLSGLLAVQGMYPQAEFAARRALEIRRTALGPASPAVVQSLQHLARLAFQQGRLIQAESLYREALQIIEDHAGPRHPTAADVLDHLADVIEQTSNADQAVGLRSRADSIRADAHDEQLEQLA